MTRDGACSAWCHVLLTQLYAIMQSSFNFPRTSENDRGWCICRVICQACVAYIHTSRRMSVALRIKTLRPARHTADCAEAADFHNGRIHKSVVTGAKCCTFYNCPAVSTGTTSLITAHTINLAGIALSVSQKIHMCWENLGPLESWRSGFKEIGVLDVLQTYRIPTWSFAFSYSFSDGCHFVSALLVLPPPL